MVDEARTEALVAAEQLADVDPAFGLDLQDRIEQQLALVRRFPKTGQLVGEIADFEVRRHFLGRFDYTILVAVLPSEVVRAAKTALRSSRSSSIWSELKKPTRPPSGGSSRCCRTNHRRTS